ncbi:large conductance mechanosensitive channel [Fervidobacterium changbaicum]|uniref:Large conductance mechanosensitive channel protein MscL n=2 Tax=Fervidobacterium TaxID=2422 RepID=A0AAI8GDD2_FERIS|nr:MULTISPECIES: large conductance mechanosensitive channel protein MscL [Fervidobacterium]AMW33238.1 large conductance mechanosensitive channel protein MscL [Fervidobacterium islandicum]QAV33298.1 large conductance mechanosensitive channel protein MscL [Fervidobacterium changbaicum]SDH07881.1 large conductance mechanosensitive channel [Fervidobacterium changbaicum]
MKKFFKEFTDFLKQYNVIGLAVAIIIGGKLNQLVSSLVNDLITPAILQPVLSRMKLGSIQEIQWHGIYWGKVLSAAIDFLIVAWIVFTLVKAMNKAAEKAKVAAELAAKKIEEKVKKD